MIFERSLAALAGRVKPLLDLTQPVRPQITSPTLRTDAHLLDRLVGESWKSPIVCDAFRALKARGIVLAFTTLADGDDWSFDDEARVLLLARPSRLLVAQQRSTQFDALLQTLLRALAACAVENAEDLAALNPRARIMAERARSAHRDVLTLRMGWELRAAGVTGVWKQIRTGQNHDLADVFLGVLDRSPILGTACRAAFLQWFKNPARVAQCDLETLAQLDVQKSSGPDVLEATHLLALTRDPAGPSLYRSVFATLLQQKTYGLMTDPLTQAYLKQIEREHTQGTVLMRDTTLARRLFPEAP